MVEKNQCEDGPKVGNFESLEDAKKCTSEILSVPSRITCMAYLFIEHQHQQVVLSSSASGLPQYLRSHRRVRRAFVYSMSLCSGHPQISTYMGFGLMRNNSGLCLPLSTNAPLTTRRDMQGPIDLEPG